MVRIHVSPAERSLVRVPVGQRFLEGILEVPSPARGVVLFAHGSGSGRHSPRNRFVASILRQSGLGTLLIDLLDEEEACDRHKVFDIPLLAHRLEGAAGWLKTAPLTHTLPLGLFGASTGAAAALAAAAGNPAQIAAVVSRGGRPDLAWDDLPVVQAPTLLIVGGADEVVLELNRRALERLRCPKELTLIPEATHLFEEPGALDEVARLAADWFCRHFHALTPSPA